MRMTMKGTAGIAAAGLGLLGLSGTGAEASALVWPVSGNVSCTWYYSSGKLHGAVDIAGNSGAAVGAARSGTASASWGWNGGDGNYVRISHGNGYTTDSPHFRSIVVRSGQRVGQLQTLGYVGSTGMTTGAHLHFDLRRWGTKIKMTAYRGQYLRKGAKVPNSYPGL